MMKQDVAPNDKRRDRTVADEKFKLPGASYDELAKIITAYATLDREAPPAEIGRAAGKPREEVSRNNGFLVAMGIIEGPPRGRRATREGTELGRAIELELANEVARLWGSLAEKNEFVQKVLTAVRVRRGMDRSALVSHVAYTAGQRKSAQTMAGANCVVDILLLAGLLAEDDGRIIASRTTPAPASDEGLVGTPDVTSPALSYSWQSPSAWLTSPPDVTVTNVSRPSGVPFEIRLNISVQCSVDELPSLPEKIRQLVRELTAPLDDETPAE